MKLSSNFVTQITTKRRLDRRTFSKRRLSSSSSSLASPPVVELQEDILFPQYTTDYITKLSENIKDVPSAFPQQLCFASRPDLGGITNGITHAYYFDGGLKERQEIIQQFQDDDRTSRTNLNESLRPYIQSQSSSLFVEAPLVKEANLEGMAGFLSSKNTIQLQNPTDDCILEIRRYYLQLGYDTVPNFLKLYGTGLPSKLDAPGTDPTTSLVTLLYSEVGRLNEVIEIWKHGNGVQAMELSRIAARKAQEWRTAIASIADLAIEFRTSIHRPIILRSNRG
jgi:hypothetical protein